MISILFYHWIKARAGLFKEIMNITTKIIDYFKTAKIELKKVVWPTKKETVRYTLIVIGMSLAVAIFFGILDFIFNIGLEKMLTRDFLK